jgi:hypothetical protein
MKNREWVILAVVLGVLASLGWLMKAHLPNLWGMQKEPDRMVGNKQSFDDIFPESMGQHFVHPDVIQNPVNLPVRYPSRAGHEISTLIEHGYAALFQPRNGLVGWMDCPPSEVG